MAQVIQYDPNSYGVANRVTAYKRSVQESDWALVPNTVIYHSPTGDPPEVAALIAAEVPMSQWKVSGGVVLQLDAADLTAIAAQQAADALTAQTERLKSRRISALEKLTPTEVLLKLGMNPDIYAQ